MVQAKCYSITNGPSKYELIVIGLSYGSAEKQIPVTFEVGSNGPVFDIRVRITKVEREDGSGESWNFKGYVVNNVRSLDESGCVSGYFSTKTRKGSIKVE